MNNPIKLFKSVLTEFDNDSKWANAEFGKIKTISNTKVGSVGQRFMEIFCQDIGIPYKFPANLDGSRLNQSPWDIEILDIKFELKTATEDTNCNFQFNHVRYHRSYDALLCLGVAPNNLFFGVWSKADVTTGVAGNLVSMEKSANASYKLTKSADQLFHISEFKSKIHKFASGYVKSLPTVSRRK